MPRKVKETTGEIKIKSPAEEAAPLTAEALKQPSETAPAKEVVVIKKAETVKSPTDPVSIRCKSYTPGNGEATPEAITFKLYGKSYVIPIGGVMRDVMPRQEAEKFINRVKRYWTAKPDLEVVEPRFE